MKFVDYILLMFEKITNLNCFQTLNWLFLSLQLSKLNCYHQIK